MNFGLAMLNC